MDYYYYSALIYKNYCACQFLIYFTSILGSKLILFIFLFLLLTEYLFTNQTFALFIILKTLKEPSSPGQNKGAYPPLFVLSTTCYEGLLTKQKNSVKLLQYVKFPILLTFINFKLIYFHFASS